MTIRGSCGLALHLGAALGLPTVGVTHRPFEAEGAWPADERGATSPLMWGERACRLLGANEDGRRPLAAHAAWRTGPEAAVEVVLVATGDADPGATAAALGLPRAACTDSKRSPA